MVCKKVLTIVAVLCLISGSLFAQNNGKSLPDGSYYTCTMDPKIHNDAPGSCPICGMDLVKVKPKKSKPKPKPVATPKKSSPHRRPSTNRCPRMNTTHPLRCRRTVLPRQFRKNPNLKLARPNRPKLKTRQIK